jgi:hypothetical protein
VDAIAASFLHSLARVDGEVWAWGFGYYGQLGNGSTANQSTPVKVSGLTGVDAIAAGHLQGLASGTASPTNGIVSGSAAAPADGTVSTDVNGDGATAEDVVEVAVTTPNAGTVSLVTSSSVSFPSSGYVVGGRTIRIEAPEATAADPLVLTFTLDVSVHPTTWDVNWAYVYRNGTYVNNSCTGATAADPDPCIASRTRLANGDVEIVVRTSRASEWAVLVQGPAVDAGGPYTVAEGSSVTLAGSASGGTAPYTFLWDPVPGLDDPTVASPSFAGIDDGVFPLRLTAIDAVGIPGTDEGEVTVTNVAPVVDPLSLPAAMMLGDELSLEAAFSDPGVADVHQASVDWGDGTFDSATVTEEDGAGTAAAAHTYTTPGFHTVKVTVTDDNGGQAQRQATVQVVYPFSGFFSPVDNPPVVNTAKAGAAIPVKFSLDGDRGLDIFATGYPKSRVVACDSGAPLDAVEEVVAAGSSELSYDPATDRYTYVWKTTKQWKNCRELIVRLADGSEHVALFRFM